MDAQLVWNTWRTVLTTDHLADWVTRPQERDGDPAGLDPEQAAIVADYGSTPTATASTVGMYRRGLVRNALGALDLVPLTRRLLRASGLDPDAVAQEFTRSVGYADDGPRFWHTAGAFVAHLARRPEFGSPARQDVLALDAATIGLARRLGGLSEMIRWPEQVAADPPAAADRLAASPAAVAVRTRCDLTGWIEDPFGFDPGAEPAPSPRWWLVWFPHAEAPHEYAELSERAARTFALLATPRTVAELSAAPDGPGPADAAPAVRSLVEIGVVGAADTAGPEVLR